MTQPASPTPTTPATAPAPPVAGGPPAKPSFNPAAMMDLYRTQKFEELATQFITVLDFMKRNTLFAVDPPAQYFVNSFMKIFLFLFTQPDFRVPEKYTRAFVLYNRTISNLAAISCFENTDAYLKILRDQSSNFVQVLTLFSARNTVTFDRKVLFDLQPELASLWYLEYGSIFYSAIASKIAQDNLQEHFNFSHPGLFIPQDVQEVFFGSTYVDGKCDRAIKTHINTSIRSFVKQLPPVINRPKRNKIAVLCANWKLGHSVYRNYYAYLQALKPKYHLTFFELGQYAKQETSLFDESYVINTLPNGLPNMAKLGDNEFQAAIYPDVGMCMESILLANRRVAPVQLCWPGHSVSTFGADIDYFVSGIDVELPVNPERNYSERLVLVPGMGVIHNKPLYEGQGLKKKTDRFVINCSWNCQKINHTFVQILKKLIDRSEKNLTLRMFVGSSSSRANDHIPLYRDITSQLGAENVEIPFDLDYRRYMMLMEEGDLTLDSFHFGGCNTISDSLFLRIPTVSWGGEKWYNRIGPEMLRLVGMQECAVTNEEDYLNVALKLIHDDAYRADVRQRLVPVDLNNTIYSTADAKYFATALDYLIDNHETLRQDRDHSPIIIPRV
jgi:hypothetical protein